MNGDRGHAGERAAALRADEAISLKPPGRWQTARVSRCRPRPESRQRAADAPRRCAPRGPRPRQAARGRMSVPGSPGLTLRRVCRDTASIGHALRGVRTDRGGPRRTAADPADPGGPGGPGEPRRTAAAKCRRRRQWTNDRKSIRRRPRPRYSPARANGGRSRSASPTSTPSSGSLPPGTGRPISCPG